MRLTSSFMMVDFRALRAPLASGVGENDDDDEIIIIVSRANESFGGRRFARFIIGVKEEVWPFLCRFMMG